MSDIFREWHNFLKTTRDGIKTGEIKTSAELSDYDIAIQYVIGIAYQHNYHTLTPEMIWHLINAFTDAELKEEK